MKFPLRDVISWKGIAPAALGRGSWQKLQPEVLVGAEWKSQVQKETFLN